MQKKRRRKSHAWAPLSKYKRNKSDRCGTKIEKVWKQTQQEVRQHWFTV